MLETHKNAFQISVTMKCCVHSQHGPAGQQLRGASSTSLRRHFPHGQQWKTLEFLYVYHNITPLFHVGRFVLLISNRASPCS